MTHSAFIFGVWGCLALAAAAACGGSSSETPPPLEPDPERLSGAARAKDSAQGEEPPVIEAMPLPEAESKPPTMSFERPRPQRARAPVQTWGKPAAPPAATTSSEPPEQNPDSEP